MKTNTKEIYNKYAKSFDEKIAGLSIYDPSYDHLLTKIHRRSEILDLACGPGNVSFYLKKKKPELSITGIDMSEEMIHIAKRKIPDGLFYVADIFQTDFGKRFDCVVCAFAIPYMNREEILEALSIIRKHLKPAGIYYVSFMSGEKEGFEKTSFSEDDRLYVHYHPKEFISTQLARYSLPILREFAIDYPEMDGSITKEIVFIGSKTA